MRESFALPRPVINLEINSLVLGSGWAGTRVKVPRDACLRWCAVSSLRDQQWAEAQWSSVTLEKEVTQPSAEPLLAFQSSLSWREGICVALFLELPVSGWVEVKGQGSLLTSWMEVEKMNLTLGGLVMFLCCVCLHGLDKLWGDVRVYVWKKIRVEHMQTFSHDWCQFESAQPHLASLVILKHFFTQKSLFPKILKIKHNLRGRWGSPNATSTTVPVYHKASFT